MGVSLKQAVEWEGSLYHNDLAALVYFSTERTKAWETRLEEYYKRRAVLIGIKMDDDQLLLRYKEKKCAGTEFHGFMSLPRELRDMIYKYLLYKGSVFLPSYLGKSSVTNIKHAFYDFDIRRSHGDNVRYRDFPKNLRLKKKNVIHPIGLICGVSKDFHGEATAIYYGCNRFVFSYDHFDLPVALFHYYRHIFCQERRHLIPPFMLLRYVSFTFDWQKLEMSYHESKTLREYKALLESSGNEIQDSEPLQPSDYAIYSHDMMRVNLLESWNHIFDELKVLVLARLELSVEECYCPSRCCRLVNEVLDRLRFNALPKIIEVIGWYDETERKKIKESLDGLDKESVYPDIRFIGKSIMELKAECKANSFLF